MSCEWHMCRVAAQEIVEYIDRLHFIKIVGSSNADLLRFSNDAA